MTVAVSPAAEEPLPEVYTAIGAVLDANFRNWDLAVDGSPSSSTLMSPLLQVPSGNCCMRRLEPHESKLSLQVVFRDADTNCQDCYPL